MAKASANGVGPTSIRTARPICLVLSIFVLSRFFCALFVYLGHSRRLNAGIVPEGGWDGVRNWWLNPWTPYDSEHFINIARNGYEAIQTPFFPLYPLLLKIGGPSESGFALWGVALSNLLFFFGLWLLFHLTWKEHNKDIAILAVFLLAFSPGTMFFSAVYSESLFLITTLACFWYARREKWVFAGVFGFLAALTRNPGVLITLSLLFLYVRGEHNRTRNVSVREVSALFLPLSGFLAVQLFYWYSLGSPFAGVLSQGLYFRTTGWPWTPVLNDFISLFSVDQFNFITVVSLIFTLLPFCLAWTYRKRFPAAYLLLVLGVMLMHLTYFRTLFPQTNGSVRYMSALFPFIQLIAVWFADMGRIYRRIGIAAWIYSSALFGYGFGLKGFLG